MEIKTTSYSKYFPEDRVMDIYIPDSKPKELVFVFIHGGGWYAGSRAGWAGNAKYYCERGHLCFSIDYRLVPKHLYPAQIEDSRLAMSYIKSIIGDFSITKPRYVLLGSSAGGHLVALLSTIDANDDLGMTDEVKIRDTKPDYTVCYCPVTTMSIWENSALHIPKIIKDFMGVTEEEDPKLYEKASPLRRIKGNEPAFLFLHGSEDETVPVWHSQKMHEELLKAKGISRLEILHGEKHGFGYGIKTKGQISALNIIEDFLPEV